MLLASDLNAGWIAEIFQDVRLTQFTDNIYSYDVLGQVRIDDSHTRKLIKCNQVNVAYFLIERSTDSVFGNCEQFNYRIIINYLVENCDSESMQRVSDFFDTLDQVYFEKYKATWGGGTVGLGSDNAFPEISEFEEVNGLPTLLGQRRYFAIKQ